MTSGGNIAYMQEPSIGLALKQAREAKGLSQAGLADASGVNAIHILKIEKGQTRSPGIDTVQKLCRALGITVGELLGECEPSPQPRCIGDGNELREDIRAIRLLLEERLPRRPE